MRKLLRKVLPFVFLLALVVGGVFGGVIETAHAFGGSLSAVPGGTNAQNHEAAIDRAQEEAASRPPSSSFFPTATSIGNSVTKMLYDWSSTLAYGLAGMVLALTGKILNLVIVQTVMEAGSYIEQGGIDLIWETFRDIANILFIFALLYTAIRIIVGGGKYEAKKIIATIIIIAFSINFSLFFTKVVFDASNVVTLFFVEQITDDKSSPVKTGDDELLGSINIGIAGKFIQVLGLTTLHNLINPSNQFTQENPNTNFLGYVGLKFSTLLIGTAFIYITAIVFAVIALMLIWRLVIFIILMITSPIAFVGYLVPKLKGGITDKWWDQLWKQAITLPTMFVFIWVSLALASNTFVQAANGATGGLAAALVPGSRNPGAVGTLVSFLIITALMVASLSISAKIGASGSTKIVGWGKSFGKATGSFVGRNTLGRAASSQTAQRVAGKIPARLGGGYAITGLQNISSAKFGGTGYKDAQKAKIKRSEAYAEALQIPTSKERADLDRYEQDIEASEESLNKNKKDLEDLKKKRKELTQDLKDEKSKGVNANQTIIDTLQNDIDNTKYAITNTQDAIEYLEQPIKDAKKVTELGKKRAKDFAQSLPKNSTATRDLRKAILKKVKDKSPEEKAFETIKKATEKDDK